MVVVAAELAITTGIPNKEAKAEVEAHSVALEPKISKCRCNSFSLSLQSSKFFFHPFLLI